MFKVNILFAEKPNRLIQNNRTTFTRITITRVDLMYVMAAIKTGNFLHERKEVPPPDVLGGLLWNSKFFRITYP